jgi:hypothetical protein
VNTWPQPRLLLLGAAALFIAGIGLLYAGALRVAPVLIFAAVLLCVLAAIATTAHDIRRLQSDSAPLAPPAPDPAPAEDASA